jgi:Ala-tRNA(Pro) deacylase
MPVSGILQSYLTDHGARYTLQSHATSQTSLDRARTARIDEDCLAKSVLLQGASGPVLAVLPASRRVDFSRLRDRLGESLELARERELERLFPDCALGAVPALGAPFGIETILDKSLEDSADIFFAAGDHETLVHMSGRDFFRLQGDASRAEIATAQRALQVARGARLRLYEAVTWVSEALDAPVGEGAAWRRRVLDELTTLEQALEAHIDKSEAADGLLEEIVLHAPRLAREVDRLREEHVELRSECERVIARAADFESEASVRRMVLSLLGRFARHRHRGGDVVYEAFGVDLGGG